MMSQICLCYHPTTTLFIDDNQNFLDTLQFEFKNKLIGQYYQDPLKALQFLVSEYQPNSFTQRCFIDPSHEQSDQLFSQIDLRQIHQQASLVERFMEVSVCVIDYTMPGINGLELSRKIKEIYPNIRILLLTGEADHNLAVQAFNEGVIDKFFKKSSFDLIETLYLAIQELTYKYFMSLSQTITNHMNSDRFKRLRDPVLIDLFTTLCQEKDIAEYYLINDSGSFLLLDRQGYPYWLAFVDSDELNGFVEYAELEEAPSSIIDALKNKVKIPFFYTDRDLTTPPFQWENHLYPAEQLRGLGTYYYALIEKSVANEWYPEHVVSYKTYVSHQL